MIHRSKQQGFTLVELMLSMAFIAILLLAIAMLVLQISTIYNKGITMRAVNQIGQTVSSDIQRTLNSARPQDVDFAPVDQTLEPSGARFCVGSTVYAWNYGKYLAASDAFNKYDGDNTPIRLVRFDAKGLKYCELVNDVYLPIPVADVTELIGADDTNIAIHKLEIGDQPAAGDESQRIYSISLVIGTNEQSIIESTIDGGGCEAPTSAVDDSYCAVNKFVFTARAGNKGE